MFVSIPIVDVFRARMPAKRKVKVQVNRICRVMMVKHLVGHLHHPISTNLKVISNVTRA